MTKEPKNPLGPRKRVRISRGLANEVEDWIDKHPEQGYTKTGEFFEEGGRKLLAEKKREEDYFKDRDGNNLQ